MAERLNFREAVARAGVSRQRLNEAIRSGQLPAERDGGPGKPTYINLEDLQVWCASQGLAMPVEALERSERLVSADLTVFFQRLQPIVEAIERLERTVEQTVERLERSQAQAIEHSITQVLTQLRTSVPIERSETSFDSVVSRAPTLNREEIIARIRHAKDVEGKSYQHIADELNTAGIPTFSGKGTWEKGSVYRFYKRK
jgi:hypothetical protein